MADRGYSEDYLNDESFALKDEEIFCIKEEGDNSPDEPMLTNVSACVPIPARRSIDMSQIRDCGLTYAITSPMLIEDHDRYTSLNTNPLWSSKIVENDINVTKMEDDDDIFQVDKSDLIQGSNLTNLNSNQDILDDLNFDDLMLPGELSCVINLPSLIRHSSGQHLLTNTPVSSFDSSYTSSFLNDSVSFYKDIDSSSVPSSPLNVGTNNSKTYTTLESNNNSINSPLILSPTNTPKHTTLHELLMKRDSNLLSPASSKILGQSVPGSSLLHSKNNFLRSSPSSRLSSSAPTHLGLDQIWQRREPRQHLISTSSLAEGGSTSSLSTGILSPDAYDFSLDETCDSDDDSDQDYDFSSDAESSDGDGGSSSRGSKREKYFWQYNVQSKGPKGQRLVLKSQLEDPHCLNEITDPVFSPDCSLQGIKHSGKARKGDGNDLTPNPKKLYVIGKELDKLNRIINDMTPVSELPFNVRPNTRKEKNKLASRACRLKKKAQHEANKIKLLGLENEHKRLLSCISQVQQIFTSKLLPSASNENQDITKNIDKIVKHSTKVRIAGQTTEFVNKVLERVKAGIPNGGLDELSITGYNTTAQPATSPSTNMVIQ